MQFRLGWEEDVYGHLTACGTGFVGQLQELTSKGGNCCGCFERHSGVCALLVVGRYCCKKKRSEEEGRKVQ